MPELIAAYWPYLIIAALIGVAIAWFTFVATRKTSVATNKRDVLDEGAAPAARNQSLIDTPAAATTSDTVVENAPEAAPPPAQAAVQPASDGDDLSRIKGLGPKLVAMLQAQGITQFQQIASWDEAEIDRIDATLGRFQGRIQRDNWVEQAKMLAIGEDSAFAEKFGRNQ
ncbi:MAG: hypothetical protein ABJ239_08995 [Erythrobacter sp.]